MTYKTRPTFIEAIQWTLENDRDIINFCPNIIFCFTKPEINTAMAVRFSAKDWQKRIGCITLIRPDHLELTTDSGVIVINYGDYLLKTDRGYSILAADTFSKIYELAMEIL